MLAVLAVLADLARRLGAPLVALLVAGCGSGGASPSPDAGTSADSSAGGGADGGSDGASTDGPVSDASLHVVCAGPLPDAGFSSLADLPVARLCGGAYGDLIESSPPPCQGLVLVTVPTSADSGDYWLFDAATGALVATGSGDNGTLSCSGAAPGFQFPEACFEIGGWSGPGIDLCTDGAADAAAGDGALVVDAAGDAVASD